MTDKLVALGDAWIVDRGSLPKRRPHDVYETPTYAVALAYRLFLERWPWWEDPFRKEPLRILDVGAGGGVWGTMARQYWPDDHIHGIEVRRLSKPEAYDCWWCPGDFERFIERYAGPPFDLIVGNPPFSIANEAVLGGFHHLKEGGCLMYLLRMSFLAGQERARSLYRDCPLAMVAPFSKRISWSGDGKTNATDHAMYYFVKGYKGDPIVRWAFDLPTENGAEKNRPLFNKQTAVG